MLPASDSVSNLFKISIRIVRIVKLTYPENGVQIFIAGVGNVMGVPYGHVNVGGLTAIKIKI